MASAFASRRVILSTVVAMKLYAGTRSRGDKQDLDRIGPSLWSVDWGVWPAPEDFYTAGPLMATYARRHGQITPRDHANDILIA